MSKAWRIRTAGCSLLSAHQLSSALAVCVPCMHSAPAVGMWVSSTTQLKAGWNERQGGQKGWYQSISVFSLWTLHKSPLRSYLAGGPYLCFYLSMPGREKGLDLWSPCTAQPNAPCQLKQREIEERFSTKKVLLSWGCPSAGVQQGGSSFWAPREWRIWKAESTFLCCSLCEVDLLIWFLCGESMKDIEVEICMVTTPCRIRNLWFINCIVQELRLTTKTMFVALWSKSLTVKIGC